MTMTLWCGRLVMWSLRWHGADFEARRGQSLPSPSHFPRTLRHCLSYPILAMALRVQLLQSQILEKRLQHSPHNKASAL